MEEYRSLHRQSIEDPKTFWATMAAGFEWRGKPVAEGTFNYEMDPTKEVFAEWLRGSQTNIAYNALDRQIALGCGDQVALLVERNLPDEDGEEVLPNNRRSSYTYSELCEQVNRLGNALKGRGVIKGDRVAVFMGHGRRR
jgi:acetyl-CoA synthetase